MVDTGATLSLLNSTPRESTTKDRILTHGVTAQREQNLSKALLVTIGNKSIWERFILVEDSLACLLGRDLLQSLDTELRLSPEGTDLIIMGMTVITESPNNELKIPEVLKSVPTKLWSRTSMDVRLLVSAQPVNIKTRGGTPPLAVR